ncbi:hypothetical protein AOQ84DRAFT_271434, partial [Glonium stellatum]
VVFVHGLTGGSIKNWTRDGVCWPRDLLSDKIHHCARIMTWGYDSASYSAPDGLSLQAGTLLKGLETMRQTRVEKKRPIVFVCHSLGGIVVKQANCPGRAQTDWIGRDENLGSIYSCTAGVIFFGTPHRSSATATLSQIVANIANSFS